MALACSVQGRHIWRPFSGPFDGRPVAGAASYGNHASQRCGCSRRLGGRTPGGESRANAVHMCSAQQIGSLLRMMQSLRYCGSRQSLTACAVALQASSRRLLQGCLIAATSLAGPGGGPDSVAGRVAAAASRAWLRSREAAEAPHLLPLWPAALAAALDHALGCAVFL